jgi:hypothetical protein
LCPSFTIKIIALPTGALDNQHFIGAWEIYSLGIPTLTQWGMIIFVVLTGLGAVYYLRRQKTAKS